jgi:hypothetical protein
MGSISAVFIVITKYHINKGWHLDGHMEDVLFATGKKRYDGKRGTIWPCNRLPNAACCLLR